MKTKILVVDDDDDLCDLLREILEDAGYEVALAKDVETLLSQINDFEPHLIILDILLGNVNAADFISSAGFQPFRKKIPILFLSGLLENYRPVPASSGHRYALRGKPFQQDQILKDIHCLLRDTPRQAA